MWLLKPATARKQSLSEHESNKFTRKKGNKERMFMNAAVMDEKVDQIKKKKKSLG